MDLDLLNSYFDFNPCLTFLLWKIAKTMTGPVGSVVFARPIPIQN